MITKVITDEVGETRVINFDKTRFSLVKDIPFPKPYRGCARSVDVWNPREAQEIADFINQNNTEYQRELQERNLLANIEKLG